MRMLSTNELFEDNIIKGFFRDFSTAIQLKVIVTKNMMCRLQSRDISTNDSCRLQVTVTNVK